MTKRSDGKNIKKPARKKRKAAKPKVRLDKNRVMILCAVICALCVLLLAATAILSGSGTPEGRKQSEAKIEKIEKTESEKKEAVKSEAAKEKKEVRKPADEKAAPAKNAAPKESAAPEKSAGEKAAKNAADKNASAKEAAANKEKAAKSAADKEKDAKSGTASPAKDAAPKESAALEKSAGEKAATGSETPAPAAPSSFGFPAAQNGAVLCFVFDDGGQNIAQLKKCVSLPFPVTVAVLPRLSHSAESAAIVRQSGNEVILHQPMQAINLKVNPGAGAITPEMTGSEIQATLAANIAEIAPIAGMNNHEGSLITEDEVKMGFVLQTVAQKGIYFLDSRTSAATKVPSVAMEMGYGYYQRDIFLDNEKTRENILSEVKKGLAVANKKGHVIMIGHVWSAEILPAVLNEIYPELKAKGYRFAKVSDSGGMIK